MLTTPDILRLDRQDFFADYWNYRPGEHVTVLGPTGSGKTYLQFQILKASATPDIPAIVFVSKPRDETVDSWNKILKYPKTKTWPPGIWNRLLHAKPNGWVLWPEHTFDPQTDDRHLHNIFRKAILDSYKRGKRILNVDEIFTLSNELGLEHELVTVWSKGRSMDCGNLGGSQKPTHIPLWAYSQAHHLFLAHDPDARARERFDEIGGIDPEIVEDAVLDLGKNEFLYIRREGPVVCILNK